MNSSNLNSFKMYVLIRLEKILNTGQMKSKKKKMEKVCSCKKHKIIYSQLITILMTLTPHRLSQILYEILKPECKGFIE